MKKLLGTTCAPITPMKVNGEIDEESVRDLCGYLSREGMGIHGVFINGTIGESLYLSNEERARVAEIYIREGKGRLVVCVQCSALSREKTLENIEHAKKSGADSIALMTPAFYPLGEKTLLSYFDEMLRATEGMPVYLYNIPSHASNDLTPAMFSCLCERHENITGVKCSMPDLIRIKEYLNAVNFGRDVIIGCDRMYLDCLMAGGAGAVSGYCMLRPELFTGVYVGYQTGDLKRAVQSHHSIEQLSIRLDGMPSCLQLLKTGLKLKGVIREDCSRGFVKPLTGAEMRILRETIEC